jgi:hypothetical protein
VFDKIMKPLHIHNSYSRVITNKSFCGILGYNPTKNILYIPVYHTWNTVVGSIKLDYKKGEVRITDPDTDVGTGVILSKTYVPKRLIIVDNLLTALCVRYVMNSDYEEKDEVAVVCPYKGKLPPLDVLQSPKSILAITEDPVLFEHLLAILPKDAILTEGSIRTTTAAIPVKLAGLEKQGYTVDEYRNNKALDIHS